MPLPRLHLFEFNDLSSAPAAVRDTVVESLSRALAWGRMLRGLVAPFEAFLDKAGVREVLDLGAGAGGPARVLSSEITSVGRTPPKFLLTDLHPRNELWQAAKDEQPASIDFIPSPVDATRVPESLGRGRVRTIINVFHHFPPDVARSVLEDAVRGSEGVFVAEGFERNPLQFANFAPAGLLSLFLNPILSPRDRLAKALLTWVTPLGLLISIWDGIASTLRVYTEKELRGMVAECGATWVWEYGTYRYPPFGTAYYFYGVPRDASRSSASPSSRTVSHSRRTPAPSDS